MNEICDNIKNIIGQIADIQTSELNNDVALMDIGFNSISYIKLVVMLEENYNIEFDDDSLVYSSFASVSKIAELVHKYVAAKNG